jgi:hypothetical protein
MGSFVVRRYGNGKFEGFEIGCYREREREILPSKEHPKASPLQIVTLRQTNA